MPRNRKTEPTDFRTIDELQAERDVLAARLEQLDAQSGGAPLRGELAEGWNEINSQIDEIDEAIAQKQLRYDRLLEIANGQPTPEAERIGSFTPVGIGVEDAPTRNKALRLLESRHTSEDLSEQAATSLSSLVRHEDPSGMLARQLTAVGAPDYEGWFTKLIRYGSMAGPHLTPREMAAREAVEIAERAMAVGSTGAGGALLPFNLDPTITLVSDGMINPVRQIARVVQTTQNTWKGVTSEGGTARYTTEAAEAVDNSPVLVQPVVDALRADFFVPFSIELDQDYGALRNELARVAADARDILEADKFINGTAVVEPEGVAVGGSVITTSGGTFIAADVYDTVEALGPRFRAKASWLADIATINAASQMETSNGARLFPSIDADRLIAKPLYEASGIAGGTASGATIAVLGDFSEYLIADRIGMSAEIVPHLFGGTGTTHYPTGQRGAFFMWRNSGTVLSANAFRVLTVA